MKLKPDVLDLRSDSTVPKVVKAMGNAVQVIIDENDAANQLTVNEMAFKTVKGVLALFPEHARNYVIGLFAARVEEIMQYEREKHHAIRSGSWLKADCPAIRDLWEE